MYDLILKLESKINELQRETAEFQKKLAGLLNKPKHFPDVQPISYFTFSSVLESNENRVHTIIGNFHYSNLSSGPLHSPVILLKITASHHYDFTGKYFHQKQLNKNEPFIWRRIENENSDPSNEYIFKPEKQDILPAYQLLSFPNFQVRFQAGQPGYINIEGFIYHKDMPKGIPSLNTISISY
ncbi:hypothetical protein [Bacillus sp. MUM 13]|uniref:hypothetical protein n=1 Tax=Bacillus sp. MUM 13 TaxID=1678001 RepID=UPI0008F5AD90|nr:hypothetical protein [Bacillus sp. MUM 13]OIK09665.1 hypothetical protein BIV59_16565 [Bacillus sp. MUM 13]